jgi:phospholipid/cholesterol/gamma-HCH transport system substrate-binding protein
MTTENKIEKKPEENFSIPKKGYLIEFLVGVFTIIGCICFAYLAVNVAQIKFFKASGKQIIAEFSNVSGLKGGAPVEIAGVQVGEVSRIELKGTSAFLTLDIVDGVDLREDDIASIRTKGIIGDRYVKIIPGNSDSLIKPGQSIGDTESAVDLEEIIGKLIHQMNK